MERMEWTNRTRQRNFILRILLTYIIFTLLQSIDNVKWSVLADTTTCPCSNSTTPVGPPQVVNVAVMFWGPRQNQTQIVWTENPIMSGWEGPSMVEKLVEQTYQLYAETVKDGIPLIDSLGHNTSVKFNFTWFHAGVWADVAGKGPNEYTPFYQQSSFKKLAQALATPNGPYGSFTFLLPPMQAITPMQILASDACETTQTCIVIAPVFPEARELECAGGGTPLPPDCKLRGRKRGARRFEFTLSAAIDQDFSGSGSLNLYAAKGFKSAFVISESWAVTSVATAASTAKQNGIQFVGSRTIAPNSPNWSSMNETVETITAAVRESRAQVVLFFGVFPTGAFKLLLEHWRDIDFLPESISYIHGGQAWLDASLVEYMLTEQVWLPSLTGANWRAIHTDINYEPFPSNSTHDSPAVFAEAFMERWNGPPKLGGPYSSWAIPALTIHVCMIMQKLVEKAQSNVANVLRLQALSISTPSVLTTVAFNSLGRGPNYDAYVLQQLPQGNEQILTPLGLGQAPILPMPGWSERVFSPKIYSTVREKLMLVITSVIMLYVSLWVWFILANMHHPVIRASAPTFCIAVILGLLLMLISNFFHTIYATDVYCSLSVWLLTLGFSLTFSALVVKNLKIWLIFRTFTSSLTKNGPTLSIRQMTLLVSAILFIDVLINLIWQLSDGGITAKLIIPDPHRLSESYYACDYSSATPYIATHLAVKCSMIILAVFLAWKLRRVSSQFNESWWIALCSYNATMLSGLIIPMIGSNVGGAGSNFLIRDYALIFLAASTCSILFLPKLLSVYTSRSSAPAIGRGVAKAPAQAVATSLAIPAADPAKQWANAGGAGPDVGINPAVMEAAQAAAQAEAEQNGARPQQPDIPESAILAAPDQAAAAGGGLPNAMSSMVPSALPPMDAPAKVSNNDQAVTVPRPITDSLLQPLRLPPLGGPRTHTVESLRHVCEALDSDESLDEPLLRKLQTSLIRRANRAHHQGRLDSVGSLSLGQLPIGYDAAPAASVSGPHTPTGLHHRSMSPSDSTRSAGSIDFLGRTPRSGSSATAAALLATNSMSGAVDSRSPEPSPTLGVGLQHFRFVHLAAPPTDRQRDDAVFETNEDSTVVSFHGAEHAHD